MTESRLYGATIAFECSKMKAKILELSKMALFQVDTYTIILALFVVNFSYRFPQLSIRKDISYGIYIYNMVFVNIAIEKGIQNNIYVYLLVIAIKIISAYISYELVGAFSRRKRNYLILK